ncbi:acetyltransferase [Neobacillus sp. FSL H8-0543]|uniref:acetyltransferase n=1 Tax=Neobacillus sp. FSL H8-0543 TaxID=2954672 RepID=UPI0031597D21
MEKVVIVGAGGLARMIFSWLPDFSDDKWEPIGFISDRLDALDGYDYDLPILSTIQEYQPEVDHVLVMAIADPKAKIAVAKELENRGARFISLIHPTALVGKNVKMGKGCVVCPRAILTCDIQIGNFVLLNLGVTIGHDAKIGNGCTVNSHSDVTGCTELGTGVFLGSHAVIMPSVKVRDFAKIGAGSVVVKQVKADTTVFGIPAKKV